MFYSPHTNNVPRLVDLCIVDHVFLHTDHVLRLLHRELEFIDCVLQTVYKPCGSNTMFCGSNIMSCEIKRQRARDQQLGGGGWEVLPVIMSRKANSAQDDAESSVHICYTKREMQRLRPKLVTCRAEKSS